MYCRRMLKSISSKGAGWRPEQQAVATCEMKDLPVQHTAYASMGTTLPSMKTPNPSHRPSHSSPALACELYSRTVVAPLACCSTGRPSVSST